MCSVCVLMMIFGALQARVFESQLERDIEMFINVTMSCRHIPGLTLAVVSDNQSWTKGFGMADIDTGRKVNEHTLFNIGSITKSFTSLLLAALISGTNNTMSWNSKVSDILGKEFAFPDTVRTTMTTLKDILSHRTGLSGLDFGMISGYPPELTRSAMTRKLQSVPEVSSYRDDFYYNNIMYMLAGHVAETLGQDSWENLTKKKLLQLLNMTQTTFLAKPSQVLADNIAKPYALKNGRLINGTESLYTIYPSEPAGAILSNAEDMVKFITFLLQKGRDPSGKQVVEEKLLSETFGIYNHLSGSIEERYNLWKPTFPVDEVQHGYGYGWFIGSYRGYKKVWHSGGLFTYVSLIWVYPDMGIGIYGSVNGPAVSNLAAYALRTIFFYISDILLGEVPWLNATTACSFPGKWKNSTERRVSNDDLLHPIDVIPNHYVGDYESQIYPNVTITLDENLLRFQCNRIIGILHPTNETNKFKLEITEPWEIVLMTRNANNETTMFPVYFEVNETSATCFNWTTDAPIKFIRIRHFNKQIPVTNSKSKLHHGNSIRKLCFIYLAMILIY